ncbi:MAG: hypothetical protein CMF96_08645 [Candidatus Marinimicrobia bacterium]|nr:hypothetical protein [Candidatus Neomarinimicrobiota bacterium]MAJ44790.1 hypothetical protein [Candidatus Neomarinimicrobiota bacterium]|tara:strand:+ start:9266 stop:9688 length:423 start_codon:yes stop_codon:yes gene_type:complete
MFLQSKFIYMLFIFLINISSILIGQINSMDKSNINNVNSTITIDDIRVSDLHKYLIKNKSIFKNHLILMSHPKYYILLDEIIKKLDNIISYNEKQPVINKTELKSIGMVFENLHFIDYNQLEIQIKNQLIKNKINFIINK